MVAHAEHDDMAALVAALATARQGFAPVSKTRQGQARGGRYLYSTLTDALDATGPALAEAGIAIIQRLEPAANGGPPMLVTELRHGRACISSTYPIGVDTGDPQRFGSAMTYARRYSYMAILGLAPENDDDGAEATRIARQQTTPRREVATYAQCDEIGRLLDALGVEGERREPAVLRAAGLGPGRRGTDLTPGEAETAIAKMSAALAAKQASDNASAEPARPSLAERVLAYADAVDGAEVLDDLEALQAERPAVPEHWDSVLAACEARAFARIHGDAPGLDDDEAEALAKLEKLRQHVRGEESGEDQDDR